MSLMLNININKIECDFCDVFNGVVYIGHFNNGEQVYVKNRKDYDLSFLTWTEVEKLMIKSLKEGKDLVFEACKDKEIIVTQEMLDSLPFGYDRYY